MNQLPPPPENPLSYEECDRILLDTPTFATEEVVIKGITHRTWKNAEPNFRVFMLDKFAQWRDRTMISAPVPEPADFYAREVLTYGQVFDHAVQLAGWLREQGVGLGTRVGIGGLNCTAWMESFVAIHLLGAVPVLLNSTMQLDAHIHCLALTKPKLTLVDVDLAKILGPASAQLLAKNIGPIYCWSSVSHTSPATRAGVQEVVSPKPSAASVRAVLTGEGLGIDSLGPDSDGMILFTSGTTSMPKGVLSDQRAALVHFISGLAMGVRMALRAGAPLEMAMDLTKPPEVQSVMLLAVPLFHVTGCLGWMMRAMAFGMRMVFMRRWSVKDAIDIIVKEKCTVIGGVPSIAVAVLQSPLLPEDHVIENVTYGGAPPAQRLGDDIVKRWPMSMPTHAYGMTETNGLHTGFTGPDYLANPEAVGPAVPICSIRIVDQETKEVLGPNQIGIVQCKGPNIMKEYVDNPKATAETLTADGWLDTGDMAMIGDNGFLYIRDRAKDVIIRGGENIASAEVENAVAMDDRIAEVAAVAVPCARLGERVGIAVSLAPGASATSHDILKTVEPRLRHPARPAIVLVLDLLPRNANGKIVKSDVKKIVHAEWAKIGGEHEAPAPRAKL